MCCSPACRAFRGVSRGSKKKRRNTARSSKRRAPPKKEENNRRMVNGTRSTKSMKHRSPKNKFSGGFSEREEEISPAKADGRCQRMLLCCHECAKLAIYIYCVCVYIYIYTYIYINERRQRTTNELRSHTHSLILVFLSRQQHTCFRERSFIPVWLAPSGTVFRLH